MVKVCHDGNERFAYIYFRSYEEAREARHAKSRLILFDKMLEIEAIYEQRTQPSQSSSRRRSMTPDYGPPPQMAGNQRTSNLRGNPSMMNNSPTHQPPNRRLPPHQSNAPMMKPHHSNNYPRNYNPMNNHHQQDHHPHSNYNNQPGGHLPSNPRLNHSSSMHPNPMRNNHPDYHHSNNNHHSNQNNNHSNPHHGNPNHMRGGGGGGPQRESKKDKFPNYLHHIPPEDDDKATRTLFVGNLEVTISDQDLKRIFEKYGSVEDIDVKRPPPNQVSVVAS